MNAKRTSTSTITSRCNRLDHVACSGSAVPRKTLSRTRSQLTSVPTHGRKIVASAMWKNRRARDGEGTSGSVTMRASYDCDPAEWNGHPVREK